MIECFFHIYRVLGGCFQVRDAISGGHLLGLIDLDESLIIFKVVFIAKKDYFDVGLGHFSNFTNPVGNVFEASPVRHIIHNNYAGCGLKILCCIMPMSFLTGGVPNV